MSISKHFSPEKQSAAKVHETKTSSSSVVVTSSSTVVAVDVEAPKLNEVLVIVPVDVEAPKLNEVLVIVVASE